MKVNSSGAYKPVAKMRNGAQCWDEFMKGKLLVGGFDWRWRTQLGC